jgi:spermidine/putrescine transport system ATP-binding protein
LNDCLLSIERISKSYGSNLVLEAVSLDIDKGSFVTLLGSSGCGKTTLLRIIAGFEPFDSGELILNGKNISALSPENRKVNTIFQNYALFPHMNVFDNVAYGPRVAKKTKAEIKAAVSEMLELVKLSGLEKRMPNELSGGERQRVAIARALINRPEILLLDEPLGSLDLKLRQHMQTELKQLQKTTGTTFIYVTHDQEEALFLSDKIAVMHDKGICQTGTPEEIYRRPSSLYTARFVGERNIIPVNVLEKLGEYSTVEFCGYSFTALGSAEPGRGFVALLHDALRVSASPPADGAWIPAVLEQSSVIGSQTRLVCRAGDERLRAVLYNANPPAAAGENVYLSFGTDNAVLLPDEAA